MTQTPRAKKRKETQCKTCGFSMQKKKEIFCAIDGESPERYDQCEEYEDYKEKPKSHNLKEGENLVKAPSNLPPHIVIKAWGLNYFLGCALEHIAFAGYKNEVVQKDGLRKAIHFLELYLED